MALYPLPHELVMVQLSQVDLLEAMFPGELEIAQETREMIEELRMVCLDESTPLPQSTPSSISLIISLLLDNHDNIELNVSIPLRTSSPNSIEAPPLRYTIRQPPYLSKSQVLQLSNSMPQDDIFEALDYVRTQIPLVLVDSSTIVATADGSQAPLVRVWFYLPSLSTKSKRLDIVNHASTYSLTGFVQAGKPGLLCLEGTSKNIDDYMKFIKSVSWGDIPSYQKKISERYREPGAAEKGVERVFANMKEITDTDSMHGQRGNRTDMQGLENWLKGLGLGGAFEKVIF